MRRFIMLAASLAWLAGSGALPLHAAETVPVPEAPAAPGPGPAIATIEVHADDTLIELLTEAGIAQAHAQRGIDTLTKVWSPRDLQVGQVLRIKREGDRLTELRFFASAEREIILGLDAEGNFTAEARARAVTREEVLASGTIHTSLYGAANDAKIPATIFGEMVRNFSYDVDFQRELQAGDRFEVMFEQVRDETGNPIAGGNLLYAAMTLSGKTIETFRFAVAPERTAKGKDNTKIIGFYNERGENMRKALLRTPIDGARLSSGFGMRRHPILGYTKFHRGVDFAAPSGTRIYAAGDGTVIFAGRRGGYGNLAWVRHANSYETLYAHMRAFAHGIHAGVHVHQGQVLGYVGATGHATGPHLHYEIHIGGKAINPLSVRTPPRQRLAGAELKTFQSEAQALIAKRDTLRKTASVN